MTTVIRKSYQSFGLAGITPFINKPNYKGYGDVASLFVEKSGYSFAYGVSLCCPSPEDSEPQHFHITFGDQFDSKVVIYCLSRRVTEFKIMTPDQKFWDGVLGQNGPYL